MAKTDFTAELLASLALLPKLPSEHYVLQIDGEEFEFEWRYDLVATSGLTTIKDWLDFIATHLVEPSRIDDLAQALSRQAAALNIEDRLMLMTMIGVMAEVVGKRPKELSKRSRGSGKATATT